MRGRRREAPLSGRLGALVTAHSAREGPTCAPTPLARREWTGYARGSCREARAHGIDTHERLALARRRFGNEGYYFSRGNHIRQALSRICTRSAAEEPHFSLYAHALDARREKDREISFCQTEIASTTSRTPARSAATRPPHRRARFPSRARSCSARWRRPRASVAGPTAKAECVGDAAPTEPRRGA